MIFSCPFKIKMQFKKKIPTILEPTYHFQSHCHLNVYCLFFTFQFLLGTSVMLWMRVQAYSTCSVTMLSKFFMFYVGYNEDMLACLKHLHWICIHLQVLSRVVGMTSCLWLFPLFSLWVINTLCVIFHQEGNEIG